MAPAAAAPARLPAAVAAVQACIAANYRRGEEGRAAVRAYIHDLAKADGALVCVRVLRLGCNHACMTAAGWHPRTH